MINTWIQLIQENIPDLLVATNESMAPHTTFKIGGPADIYVEPNQAQLIELVKLCKVHSIPYTVLGNGSNILVSDAGIRGLCIVIAKAMSDIEVDGDTITVEAGAMLSAVANTALNNSLTGMEPLAGIPGSVGGAVLMNAGAYGGEVKDVLVSANILDSDGQVKTYSNAELELDYRHSIIMDQGGIVLSAVFKLSPGQAEDISAAMKDFAKRRVDKQPLEYPSAGSTFKRPEGYFAGKLIQDCGLKGYTVGGAQVSEKHSGFVVNIGGATSADVCKLMEDVASKVYDEFQVVIEPEVRKVGDY